MNITQEKCLEIFKNKCPQCKNKLDSMIINKLDSMIILEDKNLFGRECRQPNHLFRLIFEDNFLIKISIDDNKIFWSDWYVKDKTWSISTRTNVRSPPDRFQFIISFDAIIKYVSNYQEIINKINRLNLLK